MLSVTVREQNCPALVPRGYRTTFSDIAELIQATSNHRAPGMHPMAIHRLWHCFSWKDIPRSRSEGSRYKVWTCLESTPAGKQDSGAFLQRHFSSDSKENMRVFSGIRTWGCSVPADRCAGMQFPAQSVLSTACGFSEGFICNQIQA